MEGSVILGIMGLGSAVLAAGSLARSHLQPAGEDPRSKAVTEYLTATWLSISLSPVQRAFSDEGDAIHWIIDALQLAIMVFIIVRLPALWRVQPSDTKTPM